MRQPLRTCSWNLRRSSALPIAEPPPVGGHTGAPTEPMTRLRACTLSASRLRSSSPASMLTCGSNRKRSTPSNLTPSTAALAVRSSIVSRSMNGSAPADPLPTTPGQAALCSFGWVFGCGMGGSLVCRCAKPAGYRPWAWPCRVIAAGGWRQGAAYSLPRSVAVDVLDRYLVAPAHLVAGQAEHGGDAVALVRAGRAPALDNGHHD